MAEEVLYQKSFPVGGGDFDVAGEVSTKIKAILKEAGLDSKIIRRVAIASYEAELNVVIHAESGEVDFVLTPMEIRITVSDKGPGIKDIDLAMQEGYSTATDDMREKGFGAGMGLPNIKRTADDLKIESIVGEGTTLHITIRIEE
ncbi:MAG: ATP-binding protein [Candidatus Eisenbacteria bacterium]|uniref:ATP-binding protein n=1 Tax=Eiseniibacteriota bacterium TaxID=2212470 RepID=A0A948RVC3_UNCEI|nr:ATP-binding protein [Candidatus Eisenbacteria bacterium]MBU1948890.1 ATP-binding protein [Candidatus Eisenbacteria bacterium]MBU2691545.1 ATP-binding protein [Candidatus Eisenbacteria bacterium]